MDVTWVFACERRDDGADSTSRGVAAGLSMAAADSVQAEGTHAVVHVLAEDVEGLWSAVRRDASARTRRGTWHTRYDAGAARQRPSATGRQRAPRTPVTARVYTLHRVRFR